MNHATLASTVSGFDSRQIVDESERARFECYRRVMSRRYLLLLPVLVAGCTSGEPESRTQDRPPNTAPDEPPPEAVAPPAPQPAYGPETAELWEDWLSPLDEDRTGPDAERVGDTCFLLDLQFIGAPLFRVEDVVGSLALRPRLSDEGTASEEPTELVHTGDLVLGSQLVGDSRCVYAVGSQGTLVSGFVADEQLQRVSDPPALAAAAVEGHWASAGWDGVVAECLPNRFEIRARTDGSHTISGEASWCCGCEDRSPHVGGIDGTVRFRGAEGIVGDAHCQLAFMQRGPFLVVTDDMTCGGLNVSFRGIYLRSAVPLP